jgi:hypothetical protein
MNKKSKLGAISSVLGVILLLAGTMLHPLQADPSSPIAAFAEYANDPHWITRHLTQLVGIVGIVIGLILFANKLDAKGDSGLIKVAIAGAVLSAGLGTTLLAVDGIALKAMVDAWASASAADKQSLFHAALAVRYIEIGLASMFCLAIGFTAVMYSLVIYTEERFPSWISYIGALGGICKGAAGAAIAYTGFSQLSMMFNMPANILLLVWMLILAAYQWKDIESA